MKDKIMSLLKEPSTWRGVLMFFGGIGGIASNFFDPHIVAVIDSIAMTAAGAIGMLTSDAKNTPSPADDIVHAMVTGMQEAKAK